MKRFVLNFKFYANLIFRNLAKLRLTVCRSLSFIRPPHLLLALLSVWNDNHFNWMFNQQICSTSQKEFLCVWRKPDMILTQALSVRLSLAHDAICIHSKHKTFRETEPKEHHWVGSRVISFMWFIWHNKESFFIKIPLFILIASLSLCTICLCGV